MKTLFLRTLVASPPAPRDGAATFLASTQGVSLSPREIPAVAALNPWAGRSGEAEAHADIAKGRPIKLYYQSIAGEREVIRTPGLRDCHPDRYDVPEDSRSKFMPLGADYSESIQYTAYEHARFTSATQFARAYNVTMFTMKRDDVLKICPAVKRSSG